MVAYRYFHLPQKVKVNELSNNEAEFELPDIEKGFGNTIGNSIRRILLSSIVSPAIISVNISAFQHEFMSAEGIVEDMTEIIMNFKDVKLKLVNEEISVGEEKLIDGSFEISKEDIEGSGNCVVITAGDIMIHEDIEVYNPSKVLFSCTLPQSISFKIKFSIDRGYLPVDRSFLNGREEKGEILVDGLFSPVKLVSYKVENSRIGSSTDFDKLVLRIKTDGRISPKDSLSHALQIATHFFSNIQAVTESQVVIESQDDFNQEDQNNKVDQLMNVFAKNISEMDFTVRAYNCLKDSGIYYFGELLMQDESDMLKVKNLGKKSLDELRAKIQAQGKEYSTYIYFGMDLSKYGITKENAREVFAKLSLEKGN